MVAIFMEASAMPTTGLTVISFMRSMFGSPWHGDNKRVEAGFVLPQKPDHSRGGHGVILVGGDEG